MQISHNKVVTLSYQLTVDSEVVDVMAKEKPLSFLFGHGVTIPKFEAGIEGLRAGDAFKFTLTPDEGYGEVNEENIQEFPLETFIVDGKLDEALLAEGSVVPMEDSDGNLFSGSIVEVKENSVVVDFNHPLAGMTLDFAGSIIGVREATEKELAKKSAGCRSCCNGSDGCCDDNGDGCCCDDDGGGGGDACCNGNSRECKHC
jgi:FKBP-type peptidyl-prolyl cis-trans isomerase SlyD